jgi:hypothetical protein
MNAHVFCRAYLSRIMSEVRAVLPQSEIRKALAAEMRQLKVGGGLSSGWGGVKRPGCASEEFGVKLGT